MRAPIVLLTLALTAAPAAVATAAPAVAASGSFQTTIDPTTLTTAPAAGGKHCDVTAHVTLTFSGTLQGNAEGTTAAKVHAPCEEFLAAAPGTYRDVFRFTGTYTGLVAGTPAAGDLTYDGVTQPGGSINNATMRLRGTSTATLKADATVAEGGTYSGVAKA